MFNLFTQHPPSAVSLGGLLYQFNSSFRAVIQFEQVMQDKDLRAEDRIYIVLKLFFGEQYLEPSLYQDAIKYILWFYRGGDNEEDTGKTGSRKTKAIYSFIHDDGLIYAAFLEQYGIDLVNEDLHWFQFRALFLSLSEKTKMAEVMRIRAINISQVPKEERKRYAKLKRLYVLPDMRTNDEKESDFANAFWQ